MKHLLYIFLSIGCFGLAQVPRTINYQGVARNTTGTALTNSSIGLIFKITSTSNSSFYTETQNTLPTNSLGLFSTQIGIVNPLPTSGWENTPCVLSILANFGSGYVSLPSQTLTSVPYALYALNSGNDLPIGIRDGQTLRWDSIAKVWKTSNLLTNDGQRVGIGLFPYEVGSKLHVTSLTNNDSSAISAIKLNANGNDAATKSIISGNSNGNSLNSALNGSKNIAKNIGNALAIGSYNIAESNGDAIGVYGVSSSNSGTNTAYGVYGKVNKNSQGTAIGVIGVGGTANNATAIGIYGTTDPASTASNKYAGVFENGDLLLKNGHLAALGTYTVNNSASTGFSANNTIPSVSVSTSKEPGSNDVRGLIKATPSQTVNLNFGDYLKVAVQFDKAYNLSPKIIIQAANITTSQLSSQIDVSGSGTGGFQVIFTNNLTGTSVNVSELKFNYFVIE
jgi:hypothetical protein